MQQKARGNNGHRYNILLNLYQINNVDVFEINWLGLECVQLTYCGQLDNEIGNSHNKTHKPTNVTIIFFTQNLS